MDELLYYTSNQKVNELLNSYIKSAQKDDISLSIDGIGLQDCQNNEKLYQILVKAMECAFDSCVNNTITCNKYIKVRTMMHHDQIFIKILNSFEEEKKPSDGIEEIKKMITSCEYFKYKTNEDEKEILIALNKE